MSSTFQRVSYRLTGMPIDALHLVTSHRGGTETGTGQRMNVIYIPLLFGGLQSRRRLSRREYRLTSGPLRSNTARQLRVLLYEQSCILATLSREKGMNNLHELDQNPFAKRSPNHE